MKTKDRYGFIGRNRLEKRKITFFGIGLLCALSVCLVAFRWKIAYLPPELHSPGEEGDKYVTEYIPVTRQDKPKPPPPEPKKESPREILNPVVFNVVPDNRDLPDAATLDLDPAADMPIIPDLPPDTTPLTPVEFIFVEEKPEFPGGEEAMIRFLKDNLVFPEIDIAQGNQGTVQVRFTVDGKGKVTNVEASQATRGVSGRMKRAAERAVRAMPDWKPGKQRGRPVPVIHALPIRLTIR